ncbi:MAG: 1-phosphofructokinase family hexose kinase [Planctomycetaceae bacterium]|nr:1-phosphofructokinase family hexose kinase [Planctomycetaceae bacterium]
MILTAGLSPAWQQILSFDEFRLGEVNRAKNAVWCASGKVINVAVTCAQLESPTHLICCRGGVTGLALAAEVESLGVDADWINVEHPTRVCTTILQTEGFQTTELVENAPPVSPAVLENFLSRVRERSHHCDVVALAGSLPSNAQSDYYRQLLDQTEAKLVLDFRGEGLLRCLDLKPLVVKPNREELEMTLGRPLPHDEDLITGMGELRERGAQWVVITDGPRAVWVESIEGTFKLIPPHVKVVNPIGCGDCMAGGIASELDRGVTVLKAIQFGIAAASLNATMLLPGRLRRSTVNNMAAEVQIERLD